MIFLQNDFFANQTLRSIALNFSWLFYLCPRNVLYLKSNKLDKRKGGFEKKCESDLSHSTYANDDRSSLMMVGRLTFSNLLR